MVERTWPKMLKTSISVKINAKDDKICIGGILSCFKISFRFRNLETRALFSKNWIQVVFGVDDSKFQLGLSKNKMTGPHGHKIQKFGTQKS